MILALLNFTPSLCPHCGRALAIRDDAGVRQRWYAGASHRCPCGLFLQQCDGRAMLEAARGAGDLAEYVSASEVM